MPLVRIAMRQGKSAQYRRAIADGVHANDIVMIQIVLNQRAMNVKLALYKAITERLARDPGVRPEDVLINLVPVAPEDWSFGNGKAQYVKENP
ncbi:MAG TPA: tautomerase family protein [Steroidobacteraceae bacterium]|jgi:4-oxalocrotonate tautomerase|nr:tautomerase family protein [Steroidobacteraceae bacterium]